MTIDAVMDMTREALFLVIQVSLPVLLVSLCVGLAVSIFQTVTSIQEQTLTFVPKVVCVMNSMVEFMTSLWADFGLYIGR